ncbi:MAG: SRPBCC family protein [Actinomycetota bacterium]
MPRYVVTVPSSKSARDAFVLMADMTTFVAWDPGISKVVQVVGSGPGSDAVFDVTVGSMAGRPVTLRYETKEFVADSRVLLVGKNALFTSVDLIEITPTSSGCNIMYDAKLTFNGLLAPMNLGLGLVFNKIGDRAAKGLRRVFA